MNAFTVCVDYHDVFQKVLEAGMRKHFQRWYVATSPEFADQTFRVCRPYQIDLLVTDAFTRGGAILNKWLALEELFDYGGRRGQMCVLDADIVWPRHCPLEPEKGKLYTPRRYMYPEVSRVPPESEWTLYPLNGEGEFAGYCQIFHADDPVLGPSPWHQTDWLHCGGADSFFQKRWARVDKIRPEWYCLHIGLSGMNWAGRATPYADGSVPQDSDGRVGRLRQMMGLRRRNGNYDAERL